MDVYGDSKQPEYVDSEFWANAGVKFYIGDSEIHKYKHGPGRPVYVEKRGQRDGSVKWVLTMDGFCLGNDGLFHYEHIPSSRTPEFLQKTRFERKTQALNNWLVYEADNQGKDIKLIIE